MGIISGYPKDTNISLSDKLLGTDAENSLATKNYEIGDFIAFLRTQNIAAPTLQQVTNEGANSYGNTINLKNTSISDSTIQFNVGDFFEPFIKVENLGVGSFGRFTKLGSSTIEFDGNGDYNTILEVGVGSNNTVTLPSETGTLALQTYKSYVANVDYNSVNNVFIDEIGFSSVVVTNPSNGQIVFTKTGVFTGIDVNKICFLSQNLSNSGQVFVTLLSQGGPFGENPNDKMTLNIFDMTGGQTGTPSGNVIIEVRIYN
jgi:hypothetical protein